MAKPIQLQKLERAKRIVNTSLQSLADALERGESAGLKQHLKAMSRFSRYSYANVMLIFGQRPEATHVEGFHGWRRLGRYVKKGESGLMIRAPITIRKDKESETDSGQGEVFFGFRAAYVFDISQTEGEPLPEMATASGEPGEFTEALKAYAASKGITVETDSNLPYEGISAGGSVAIRADLSPAESFSTLAHELAHEVLHWPKDAARQPKQVRETEAEAVAFVVCHAVGIDSLQAASDYIQLYQGNAATLWASLERVQQAASEMIAAISTPTTDRVAA